MPSINGHLLIVQCDVGSFVMDAVLITGHHGMTPSSPGACCEGVRGRVEGGGGGRGVGELGGRGVEGGGVVGVVGGEWG